MTVNKELLHKKHENAKKEKKKFNKNSSFNGIESKKSPKNRRKSLASVLLTSTTKKKREKAVNEWSISETTPKNTVLGKEQLIVSDDSEEFLNLESNTSILSSSKTEDKNISLNDKKKLLKKTATPQNTLGQINEKKLKRQLLNKKLTSGGDVSKGSPRNIVLKKKQLIVTDDSEELVHLEISTSVLKSPKTEDKKTAVKEKKKSKKTAIAQNVSVSESSPKNIVLRKKQLIVSDDSEELVDLEISTSVLESPVTVDKTTSVKDKRKLLKTAALRNLAQIKSKKIIEQPLDGKLTDREGYDIGKKFGIQSKDIAKAVEAAIKLHRDNPKLKNQLFEDRIPLFLHVGCHQVPKGPSRIIRIPLPNSHLTPDDEICLIVPEVKGIKNIEHEKHVEHYENLLRNKGVENIKKIMTFHEFRTEYETFEQKSRLVDLYDVFLVDGKISGKVVHKCGKIFYNKRKVPTPVKLQATKLKEHIDKSLSKAFFMLHLKGDSYSVSFGHDKMPTGDLVDNVFAVIECLDKEFPGRFENIKGLHISALRSTTIPIYSSFKNSAKVETPKQIAKRPKAYKSYKDELSTLLNAEVEVQPTGRVLVTRTKDEEDSEELNEKSRTKVGDNEGEGEVKVKKRRKRKHSEINSVEVKEGKTDEKVSKKKKIKSNERVEKTKKKQKQKVDNGQVVKPEKVKKNKRKHTEEKVEQLGDIIKNKKEKNSKKKIKNVSLL